MINKVINIKLNILLLCDQRGGTSVLSFLFDESKVALTSSLLKWHVLF